MHQLCTHISDGLNKLVWDVSGRSSSFGNSYFNYITKGRCVSIALPAPRAIALKGIDQFNLFLMCQQYHGKTRPARVPAKGGFRVFCWWSLRLTYTLTSALSLEHGRMATQMRPSEEQQRNDLKQAAGTCKGCSVGSGPPSPAYLSIRQSH